MKKILIVGAALILFMIGASNGAATSGGGVALVLASPSSVVGPPTITDEFINRVLEAYHSPAAGRGQALHDLGVQYGIDPVWALAFFLHESSMGLKGWGAANHSLGNIRCTPGYACGGGYRAYSTWEAGFKDWFNLIRTMYVDQLGLKTVEQIIPVYAPAKDHNNESAYISALHNSVDAWRAGRL